MEDKRDKPAPPKIILPSMVVNPALKKYTKAELERIAREIVFRR